MTPALAARIESRIDRNSGDCWLWTGTINHKGYGAISVDGRTKAAHRVVYEMRVAAIPDGLVLDHLCRVRHCVNPAHLEPVTTSENNRRSAVFNPACKRIGLLAANRKGLPGNHGPRARRTHCLRGHELVGSNVLLWSRGRRRCRECERVRCEIKNRARAIARQGGVA